MSSEWRSDLPSSVTSSSIASTWVPMKHHNAARYTQTEFTDMLMNLIAPSHNWQYTQCGTDDSHGNTGKRKTRSRYGRLPREGWIPIEGRICKECGRYVPCRGAIAPIGLVIIPNGWTCTSYFPAFCVVNGSSSWGNGYNRWWSIVGGSGWYTWIYALPRVQWTSV